MEYRIKVLPEGRDIVAPAGAVLLDALRDAGYFVDAPCGGHGKCGKCTVLVDGLPTQSCRYRIDRSITVELPNPGSLKILERGIAPEQTAAGGYGAAFDIGTTTVVCALLDAAGKTVAVETTANPQASFGADVVSRIHAVQEGHGQTMTGLIRGAMNKLLENCCTAAGIAAASLEIISVVGNPAMQQLFFGMPLDNLAKVPFAPVIAELVECSAVEYFPMCPMARLVTPPDLGGFVGADTVGCILASQLQDARDTVLLVDIGTNGEMVLCHRGRMVACATAAGPALEGANISCGMRAAAGAIDHVTKENIHVIGGGEAVGICGSGLIDAVAVMLEQGILNRRGRVLTADHRYALTERVQLTQEDIRQVQLAKGAIAAGIELMACHLGIRTEDIDRCILAGTFGTYLDPNNACRIGLLPEELRGKIRSQGNLALEGAKMLVMDAQQRVLAQELTERVEFLELATQPGFQRCFAEHMFFREESHG